MAGIFISYRRGDSSHAAARLVDRLAQVFPRQQLFMDIDAIEPGLDFLEVINAKLAEYEVLLAVIGPGWADACDEDGTRRLDKPEDYVRMELEAALAGGIRVIPLLVDGAPLPKAESLPEGLKSLVRRNAVRLTHERFGAEAENLAQSLVVFVGQQVAAHGQASGKVDQTPLAALHKEKRTLIGRVKAGRAYFVAAYLVAALLLGAYHPPEPPIVRFVAGLDGLGIGLSRGVLRGEALDAAQVVLLAAKRPDQGQVWKSVSSRSPPRFLALLKYTSSAVTSVAPSSKATA